MDSNPNSKELKKEDLDMISKLPDSILSIILSKLPLKKAMATSILSTRWKNVFPFGLPPIELFLNDSSRSLPKEGSSSFVNFVDRLFNITFSDNTCIHSMVLICKKNYGNAKIISWLCAAVRLSVRYLLLDVSLKNSRSVLQCLDGCATLTKLKFRKRFELCVPDNFRLPNLKKLVFQSTTFRDDNGGSINEFISGCPMLEDLMLLKCKMRFLGCLHIRSPSLKYFALEECSHMSTCDLLLDAPNLEVFSCGDVTARSYAFSRFKALDYVHFDVGSDKEFALVSDEALANIVTIFSSTNGLYLADSSTMALHNSMVPLPEFQNLTCLEICYIGFPFLARLLLHAPKLKELTIQAGFDESGEGYAGFVSLVPRPPFCLNWHLKKIQFGVFKGDKDVIKLIEYFLMNGKVIEKLELYCLPCKKRILKRLLPLPKHSKILLGPQGYDFDEASLVPLSDAL